MTLTDARAAAVLVACGVLAVGCSRNNPEFGLAGGSGQSTVATGNDATGNGNGNGNGDGDGNGTNANGDSNTTESMDDGDLDGSETDAAVDECDIDERCVRPPPPPWSGPVALQRYPSNADLDACPDRLYAQQLVKASSADYVTDPIPCCSCDSLDPDCGDPLLLDFQANDCPAGAGGTPETTPCVDEGQYPLGESFRVVSEIVTNGLCVANVPGDGDAGLAATETLNLCGTGLDFGRSCGPTSRCVPRPSANFAGLCVYTSNVEQPCPQGWPQRQELAQLELAGCQEPCSCATVLDQACTVELQLFENDNCGGLPASTMSSSCWPSSVLDSFDSYSPEVIAVAPVCQGSTTDLGTIFETAAWTACCVGL